MDLSGSNEVSASDVTDTATAAPPKRKTKAAEADSKSVAPILYPEGFVAEAGADVAAGDRILGKTGTAARGRGLAMVRLDRAQDALEAGQSITAGGLPVELVKPDWVSFPFPGSGAKAAE